MADGIQATTHDPTFQQIDCLLFGHQQRRIQQAKSQVVKHRLLSSPMEILLLSFALSLNNQNFKKMKEYLLLFRNASAENGYLATSQDMAADIPKWQSWIGNIAMQGKLVSTAPIEYNAETFINNGFQVGPYKEANSVLVSGFLICKADSLDEAKEWASTCPILKYPNSSVEIRPLIPFPIN